jgi:hypothetical protein
MIEVECKQQSQIKFLVVRMYRITSSVERNETAKIKARRP